MLSRKKERTQANVKQPVSHSDDLASLLLREIKETFSHQNKQTKKKKKKKNENNNTTSTRTLEPPSRDRPATESASHHRPCSCDDELNRKHFGLIILFETATNALVPIGASTCATLSVASNIANIPLVESLQTNLQCGLLTSTYVAFMRCARSNRYLYANNNIKH
jgi:hypothetical protein